ncbi:hypothetical protein VP1G_04680 [Cytospora mali]|uniref:Uncharacterized protein n=1 Tax=Cytospora mali TaxID=578113 RepID=A0A194V0G7_CYTMA|nr:hypothetical protein VP1G_04680 [Valsa mali var. pyri (nom. inval.)]
MAQAPTFKPDVPAPLRPGSFPWVGNLAGFARRQRYASYMLDLAGSLLNKNISRGHLGESLKNETTASFPNPAPGHRSLFHEGWHEVCLKYAPFGGYVTLFLVIIMVVGPEVVDLVDGMRAQNTEEQRRIEGSIRKSSLEADFPVLRKNPLDHEKNPEAEHREHIALIDGLNFNKAKTHKLLQHLEKWDKVNYIRVNNDHEIDKSSSLRL